MGVLTKGAAGGRPAMYLPTNQPTYQPTYLPTYLPTTSYLPTYLPTYLSTSGPAARSSRPASRARWVCRHACSSRPEAGITPVGREGIRRSRWRGTDASCLVSLGPLLGRTARRRPRLLGDRGCAPVSAAYCWLWPPRRRRLQPAAAPDHHVTAGEDGAAYRAHASAGSSREVGRLSQNLLSGLQPASSVSSNATWPGWGWGGVTGMGRGHGDRARGHGGGG